MYQSKLSQLFTFSSLLILLFLYYPANIKAQVIQLTSPDERIVVTINTTTNLGLSIELNQRQVVEISNIEMDLGNGRVVGNIPREIRSWDASNKGKKRPIVPLKDAIIEDNFNQLTLKLENDYAFWVRAYNDGVAYRFVDFASDTQHVVNEDFEISFPKNASTYFPKEESMYSHNERTYLKQSIADIKEGDFCSLPVMFDVGAAKVLFTETELHDYPGLFLERNAQNTFGPKFSNYVLEAKPNQNSSPDRNQIITKTADYIAKVDGGRSYPWRVFMVSDKDETFIESNLATLLSKDNNLPKTDWIKPGKVAWDWYNANNIFGVDFESGINDATYKYYIDFASENNIEYVILDEGWTKSTTEILEDNEAIDVKGLIKYAESKGVGIILWVLWKPLNENMDGILKLYSEWGAKGVKVDFMQRSDQYMVRSLEEIAKIAAKYQLLVDYHGVFKPAGIERAWPNVINYEGVKGNEWNKWSNDITPEHNVTIPFIRMAAGPIDFTPGSMTNTNEKNYQIRFERPMSMGTRCHQVAMYVVYEAPLQMMCESPSIYKKEQETVDFITQIPTVWDETIVLEAAVSDYIVLARRKGENWYIGAMTDWTAREFSINLDFLSEGSYEMELMKDGKNVDKNAEDYWKETLKVDKESKLNISLASGGGWVAILKML